MPANSPPRKTRLPAWARARTFPALSFSTSDGLVPQVVSAVEKNVCGAGPVSGGAPKPVPAPATKNGRVAIPTIAVRGAVGPPRAPPTCGPGPPAAPGPPPPARPSSAAPAPRAAAGDAAVRSRPSPSTPSVGKRSNPLEGPNSLRSGRILPTATRFLDERHVVAAKNREQRSRSGRNRPNGSCGALPAMTTHRMAKPGWGRSPTLRLPGPVAQRSEQGTHNPSVGGSIPPGPTP